MKYNYFVFYLNQPVYEVQLVKELDKYIHIQMFF